MFFTVLCLNILFKCVAGRYANEQDVLNAFTDVYDIVYAIRDSQGEQIRELKENQAKQIQECRDKDLEKTEEIKFLKMQIEELQKLNAPTTCSELWKQDITRNQEVFLDSDGINYGEKPVKAFCTFPSSNVTFGEELHVNITQCEGADCFHSPNFQNDSSTQNQIQNVIDASTSCSQKWLFNCKSAPLKEPVSLVFIYLHLSKDRVFTFQSQ